MQSNVLKYKKIFIAGHKGMVGSAEQYPSIEYTFKATPKMLQEHAKTTLNLITFQKL